MWFYMKFSLVAVCGLEIFSGLALIHHMHNVHPDMKPYLCEMCESSFNNLKEVSSHKSVVRRKAEVGCKFCPYRSTTKACMRQHVRIHSKGLMKCKD